MSVFEYLLIAALIGLTGVIVICTTNIMAALERIARAIVAKEGK